jgi:membrane protease YdiL (CAAX protease family)
MQVPWRVWQAVLVFALAWLLFPVLLILALRFAAPSLPPASAWFNGLQSGGVYATFGLVLVEAVAAMGLVLLYLRRYHLGWQAVGWRRVNIWRALGTLLMVFGIFILVVAGVFTLVTLLFPHFNANQPQVNEFTGAAGKSHHNIALLALVIIPPIIEETYFRGFLFPALSRRLGLIGGAIVTSLFFGLAHLQANVSVYTFVLSLVLCYLYIKLKSIVPGIVLHMLNNFLAYLALVHS